jgi:L-aspartate oxidase
MLHRPSLEWFMNADVIVIGSGAAGLTAALSLAERLKVLVLAKGTLTGGSTAWAQGGIAAVLDAGDTFEDHIRDTMVAGAGLNRQETVEYVVERAPLAIERLAGLGVPFNTEGDHLHLHREGGIRTDASPMWPTPPAGRFRKR